MLVYWILISGMRAGFWKLMLPFSGGNMCFRAVAKCIPFFKEWVSATGRSGQGIIYVSKGAWLLAACVDLLPGQHVLLCEAVK